MRIESSQLQLAANHVAQNTTQVRTTVDKPERLSRAPGQAEPAIQSGRASNFSGFSATSASTVVQLSQQSVDAAQVDNELAPATEEVGAESTEEKLKHDSRYQLVKSLFEQITGSKFEESSFELHETPASAGQPGPASASPASAGPATPAAPNGDSGGPQVRQTRTTTHTESEQTQFSARGSATTSDGRKIDFSVNLNLERSHSSQSSQRLVNGKPVDPLVLNLEGKSVQLRDASFSFDLNGDGQEEQVHFVNSGSAFLALDKNGDGQINNGQELFGPQSGNGFQDLAAYDSDQNQVIDESDPVFNALRLYNKDASGQDQVSTLAEKGVGAIFLANANTPFSLKDGQNQTQGLLRSTGVYLREDGSAGTVQHVDLVV